MLASYADGTTTLSNDVSIVVTAQAAVTPPEVAPFDCSTYPALIQVLRADGVGVNVKQLDVDSGGYSLIYSIPLNRTAPAFEMLNAVGLHPVDRVAYGLMKFSDETSYLVRFDDQDVAFLAKVPHSPAGTVDDDGSFLWATSDGLYRIEDVQSLSGFGTRGAATDLSAISPMIGVAADTWDLAAVRVDLGDGEAPYAMGFTGSRQLRIYRYDDSPGSWLLAATTADGSNSAIPLSGFGAAWSHDGEVFFGANSGLGVYEVLVPTIDLAAGTVTVRRVANSAKTAKNDGTNCVGIDVPPPTTTTEPPAGTTTTEPPAGTTTTEPPAGTTTTEPPATTLSGGPEPTTSSTEEPASPETQDSDGDGFTDSEEVNQLRSDPLDANDPGGETVRQALTQSEETSNDDGSFPLGGLIAALAGLAVAAGLALTAAGQALWGRITQFFAGSILGALILGRKRDRCRHCNKPLTDQEGILVDENESYECAYNPDGDHHQLKRRRES